MTIRKQASAAELLTRQLKSAKGKPASKITDPFAEAVARRLEARHIAKVPGLPDDAPELDGLDIITELRRRNEEFQARREAQRQAEEEVAKMPHTTAGILAAAIRDQLNSGSAASKPLGLNGAGILRAALAGGAGTIEGRNE